ncbi:MAG: acyl-[Prevotella sp.]|nr:acyl-[acyl-carrier-protein] thioesterase [Prevotella sp.]
MEQLSKIGKYPFMAEPFHCDFQKHLFMGHLGNHLLNAADFHSNDRGFGMNYLNTINKTWVLSRLAVEMVEMPEAYDRFFVYTWVESAMRYFTNRNFKVEEQSTGKVYGYGRSVWAMIDTETRQPVNLMEIHDGDIANYVTKELDCPIDKSSRVRITDTATLVAEVKASYDDIDINCHVNSIKYIEHVLDLFNLDWYRQHFLQRFEIAYVAEAHEGEMLRFYQCENEPDDFSIRITAQASAEQPEVEVARSRMLFTQFK